ncbi:hypothetical protein TYRP_013440 [Tyrophagus putrescentiae]|nr:hypothetical protein TYRP_013440 [Tyrophagus putrescentiae]
MTSQAERTRSVGVFGEPSDARFCDFLTASGGNGEMDSGLCVLMRAAQDPASLKTKSTVWTLAPRRGARCRTLVLGRSAGHEVGDDVALALAAVRMRGTLSQQLQR